MDPYGKRELLSYYSRHLERFGDSPEALRWTPRGQIRRYLAMLQAAGDLAGKDVLDFGCGKGDLYAFLRNSGRAVGYCGIDVNPGLVDLARKKYPQGEFFVHDIEEAPLERSFDVILVCGVFNLRIAGVASSLRTCLKRLMTLCRESLHLNVPSSRAPCKDIEMHYEEPGELLAFARRELSPAASLREDLVEDELFLSVFQRGVSGARER